MRKTRAAPAPHPVGLCCSLPAKAGIHGPGRGESPDISWSPARDIHCLWDCFEELPCFLKMKGMLEQPAWGGVGIASRLGWCWVPISRVSPKPRLPSAAASTGEMRTGRMGACLGFQTQAGSFAWDKWGKQWASFQVLASSACWQHAGTGTAAEDAAAALCKHRHLIRSPTLPLPGFPRAGLGEDLLSGECRQGGDSGMP